jgi:GH24 family phage-related lysozyme (muramidase)
MSKDVLAIGLNIRAKPDSKSDRLGLLPRGARIEIGGRSPNGKWGKIKRIVEGKIAPVFFGQEVLPDASTGWVYLGELDAEREPQVLDQIVALEKPYPIKAGELIGYLGEYQEYIDAQSVAKRGVRPLLHLEVFSGDDVKTFVNKSRDYAKKASAPTSGLFVIEKGAKLVSPSVSDITLGPTELVLPAAGTSQSAKWIKVYRVELKVLERDKLGAYNKTTKSYAKGETWSGWYVGEKDDQRTQSEAEMKRLGYKRREVKVGKGQPIWVERNSWNAGTTQESLGQSIPAWSKFPLDVKNQNTPPADLVRVISSAEFEKFPAEDQIIDADGHRWWHVNVRTNIDSKAPSQSGWVSEKGHALAHWQSPWAWPGFELVEEKADPITFMQSTLLKAGIAKKDEITDFKARADSLDSGEMFQKIYKLLDVNKDKHLDKDEIKKALQQPLLAQSMSRIIAKYESEWGGDMSKWDALDPLILDGKLDWKAEKIRIKSLLWWPKVVAKVKGFPTSPEAYHFHPIALISNFMGGSGCPKECVVDFLAFEVSNGTYRASKEAMEWMLKTEKYEEKPYVPTGKSQSGITVGYGYDLGQQSKTNIRTHLAGLYTADEIEKFVGVAGLKQENARNALSRVSHISISKDNAAVLANLLKKSYARQVVSIYPEVIKLHPHCQGSLLSLVFNRGPELETDRRREMLEIQNDLRSGNQKNVPDRIRSMKRLWVSAGQRGLLTRRDKEAEFFERGLKCDCWE